LVSPEETTGINILVVMRNEAARYGVQYLLDSLGLVRRLRVCPSLPRPAPFDAEQYVLIVALHELDDEQRVELAGRPAGEAKLLVLLDESVPMPVNVIAGSRADGFLYMQDLTAPELKRTLERITQGELSMPSRLGALLLNQVREDRCDTRTGTVVITPRERQVLGLLVEGLSNKQIARRLSISLHGVKRLVANILAKLNCPNRTLAVARALRDGLHVPPDNDEPGADLVEPPVPVARRAE
jgi:DNA-binding NarL/FixJ family response regulator